MSDEFSFEHPLFQSRTGRGVRVAVIQLFGAGIAQAHNGHIKVQGFPADLQNDNDMRRGTKADPVLESILDKRDHEHG